MIIGLKYLYLWQFVMKLFYFLNRFVRIWLSRFEILEAIISRGLVI
jgi:hypothetical protein